MPEDLLDGPYRLGRIEKDIAEMKTSVVAIQAALAAMQIGFPATYMPRTESNMALADMNRRIEENTDRLTAFEARQWAATGGLLLALIVAVIGLLRTLPPGH